MYKTPDEYYFRLHHVRPRFKDDVESVLLYIASEISKIGELPEADFKIQLNESIRQYPGNATKEIKTINNWRTEISALFGLINTSDGYSKPSNMSILLSEKQDLIEFFRYFLFYFQYPGAHVKAKQVSEQIHAGIRFKPAKYLIQVMKAGMEILGEPKFGLTKAEATHCIFNDLRVTRDQRSPKDTATLIIENREKNIEYVSDGDVVRYAGDILDYMELANLVTLRPNYQYYLNTVEAEVLQAFMDSTAYFVAYDEYYGEMIEDIELDPILSQKWYEYVNDKLDSSVFEADIASIIGIEPGTEQRTDTSTFVLELLSKIRRDSSDGRVLKTKEIGDVGEALVIQHEKVRLIALTRDDLARNVTKLPEALAMGYDISSYDGVEDKMRCIEVKTTISRNRVRTNSFHMSTNEWIAAKTYKDVYFVYRLLISGDEVTLFIIQDIAGKEKQSLVDMVPRNGAEIKYTPESGWEEELLA